MGRRYVLFQGIIETPRSRTVLSDARSANRLTRIDEECPLASLGDRRTRGATGFWAEDSRAERFRRNVWGVFTL